MLKIIIIFVIFFQISYSRVIFEKGYGSSPELAKKNALENISKLIQVNVKTEEELIIVQDNENEENLYRNRVSLKSNLIIIGVKYNEVEKNKKNMYICEAYLDLEGIEKHKEETERKNIEILEKIKKISQAKTLNEQQDLLSIISKDIDEFERMYPVLLFFKNSDNKIVSKDIEIILNNHSKKISLDTKNIEILKNEINNLMKKNTITLKIKNNKDELKKHLNDCKVYLEKINNRKIKFVNRVKANHILYIEIVEKENKYGFNYKIKNLKDGTEAFFLEGKNNYSKLEEGFLTEIMLKGEIVNKKIGELVYGEQF